MKTLINCFFIAALFSLVSCATTEEIWINKDQSIRKEIKMDMGMIVPFLQMQEGMAVEEEENKEDQMDIEVEQGYDKEEEDTAEDFGNMMQDLMKREKIDTLISFKDIFEQQMKERGVTEEELWKEFSGSEEIESLSEQEREGVEAMMKSLLKMEMRINIDVAEEVFLFTYIQAFDNPDELNSGGDMMDVMSKLSGQFDEEEEGNAEAEMIQKMMTGSSPIYKLDNGEFSISRPPLKLDGLDDEMKMNLQMAQGMMGGADYTYVIHFPKKVKKVNIKDAEIDGKTVTVKGGMPSLSGEDEGFNLVVKYK